MPYDDKPVFCQFNHEIKKFKVILNNYKWKVRSTKIKIFRILLKTWVILVKLSYNKSNTEHDVSRI